MNIYEVKLHEFKGPMDKLLELIEAKKLDITQVGLAEVTGDFLNYIRSLESLPHKVLADFISIAAKLILIKSHTLLPELTLGEDERAEIGELEKRLYIYKQLKGAERNIQELWSKNISYGREFMLNVTPGGFYLTQKISPEMLLEALGALIKNLEIFTPKRETERLTMISFEEKLKELMGRIESLVSSSFSDIVKGKEKSEIVVLFLALLHLLKDGLLMIEQEGQFGEIKVAKNNK
ncbi:MAG: segregation/condensation protein A [Candidatus Colwellbacteria bacterium]|nr:segregation/condensation protein A [Candidatus Colwellbacteria bacterium]